MFGTLIGPYPAADERTRWSRSSRRPGSSRFPTVGVHCRRTRLRPRSSTEWRAAAASTTVAVKQALLGPFSAARPTGGDARSRSPSPAGAIAVALAAAGCPLVEIEEPEAVADRRRRRRRRVAFAAALRRLTDVVDGPSPPVAGPDRRQRRPAGCGNALRPAVRQLRVRPDRRPRQLAAHRRGPGRPRDRLRRPGPGTGRGRPPETLVWAAHYAASTKGRGLERVGLSNASSSPASRGSERGPSWSHSPMQCAPAAVRDPKELAASLDPRAVDIRSAALGGYDPDAPRRG